jgi:hypothetical protein
MERCLSNLVHQRGAFTSPFDIWQEWSNAAGDRPDMDGNRKQGSSSHKSKHEEEEAVGVEF